MLKQRNVVKLFCVELYISRLKTEGMPITLAQLFFSSGFGSQLTSYVK